MERHRTAVQTRGTFSACSCTQWNAIALLSKPVVHSVLVVVHNGTPSHCCPNPWYVQCLYTQERHRTAVQTCGTFSACSCTHRNAIALLSKPVVRSVLVVVHNGTPSHCCPNPWYVQCLYTQERHRTAVQTCGAFSACSCTHRNAIALLSKPVVHSVLVVVHNGTPSHCCPNPWYVQC